MLLCAAVQKCSKTQLFFLKSIKLKRYVGGLGKGLRGRERAVENSGEFEKHIVDFEWATGIVTCRLIWEGVGMIVFSLNGCWSVSFTKGVTQNMQGWGFDDHVTFLMLGFSYFVMKLHAKKKPQPIRSYTLKYITFICMSVFSRVWGLLISR